VSDSGELMKKADALLERYRRARAPSPDPAIPVLTEVVEAAPPHADPTPAVAGAGTRTALSEKELDQLAARLREQVRAAVDAQLRAALGAPFEQRLETYVRAALDAVAAQMRNDLEALVHQAVAEATQRAAAELRQSIPPRA